MPCRYNARRCPTCAAARVRVRRNERNRAAAAARRLHVKRCVECQAPAYSRTAKRCRPCVAERRRVLGRARAAANPGKEKARSRAKYRANPQAEQLRLKRWAQANPEKIKATYRTRNHRRRARLCDACSPGVTPAEWAAVCEQFSDGETVWCAYCEKPANTVDHVRSIAHGGRDEPDNVVPACGSCNSSKRNKRLLWQWIGKGIASACLEVA